MLSANWRPDCLGLNIFTRPYSDLPTHFTVNIMGADGLTTQEAKASANMILILLNRYNSVPTHWELRSQNNFQFQHLG